MELKRSGKGAKLDGWREKVSHKEFHYVAYVLEQITCSVFTIAQPLIAWVSETLQREFINCLGIRVTRVLLRTGNLLVRLTMFQPANKLSIWRSRQKSRKKQHAKGDTCARGGERKVSAPRCFAARNKWRACSRWIGFVVFRYLGQSLFPFLSFPFSVVLAFPRFP